MRLRLNERPSFPPVCWGRFYGSTGGFLRTVRALGDIEILKSCLPLVWSEWDEPGPVNLYEMYASLWEGFSGIGMEHHRQDVLRRLDHVLGQLDLRPEHLHPKLDTDGA